MARKVTKLEHSHVEVLVTVDEANWKKAQEDAFKKIAANVTVDGFRKGKAPANLVKAKVDQVKVMDDAINKLLPELYREILEQDKIKPYAQPKVDVTKLSDKELEVKFLIVTEPEIKLGKYKGHEIGKKEIKVSEKDVKEALENLQKQNATLVVKDGESVKGDTVVIDFKGFVDDKQFDGGTADNYELELGSGSFIPGFEDQLIGKKSGDHVDVKVTFPTQYTPELAGKDALFVCDVHEVKEKKLPELNDEFVKDLGIAGVETLEALKANKKEELKANKEKEARREYLAKLYEAISKDAKCDIPEEIVNNQVESMKKDLEGKMAQSGLTLEKYLQIVGQKLEDYEANLRKDALRDGTIYLLLENIG